MKTIRHLTAIIPGPPITWGRPVDTGGRRLNPARYRRWKSDAVIALQVAAGMRSFAGEIDVDIILHPDRVEISIDETETRRPGTGIRGDVDNYAKAVLDAIQAAGVIANDRDVTVMTVRIARDLT